MIQGANIFRWLRWPTYWYATPTFGALIALQAPHWTYTSRVFVALGVWLIAGVAIDVWMTRLGHRVRVTVPGTRINRFFGFDLIFAIILIFGSLALRPWASPPVDTGPWRTMDAALKQAGLFLPGLDYRYSELIRTGRDSYFLYAGGFYLLFVIAWLAGFLWLYGLLVRRPLADFAKAVEAKKNYGKPPYGSAQRKLAMKGMALAVALTLFAFLPFSSDQTFAETPLRADGSLYLGGVPLLAHFALWLFHGCRLFLATLFPNGLAINE